MKLKPEIKAAWVKALRSGEYQQGKRALNRDNKFCCLGVLCDLHAKEVGVQWTTSPGAHRTVVHEYMGSSVFPPPAVLGWAVDRQHLDSVDIVSAQAAVNLTAVMGGHHGTLANHNDYTGASFAEIADAIEAHG